MITLNTLASDLPVHARSSWVSVSLVAYPQTNYATIIEADYFLHRSRLARQRVRVFASDKDKANPNNVTIHMGPIISGLQTGITSPGICAILIRVAQLRPL